MRYDFLPPQRIVFGWGRRNEAGTLAKSLGRRAFLVTGSRTLDRRGAVADLESSLRAAGVDPVRLASLANEPETGDVDEAVAKARGIGLTGDDLVIGFGGGSALDLAKAVAAIAPQEGEVRVAEFLEGVGTGRTIDRAPLPVFAIPTTAGTGTEATKNAVISSTERKFKKSLRSDRMMPRVALIDPELTVSVPPDVTAATGMDAITQLIESYISRRAQPIPRALCVQGLEMAVPAIVEAVENGASRSARERMSHAALLSGMALANSGLGMAHGVAAALGVCCGIPHGLACAVMLPAALRVNADVCRADYVRLAPIMTGRVWKPDEAAVSAVIEHVEELNRRLQIPSRLSELGVKRSHLRELVPASRGNSMSGNPRDITDEELHRLLEDML